MRNRTLRGDSLDARGFTLVEMILVIVLIGAVLGLVIPVAFSTLDRLNRESSIREVAHLMKKARSQAIASKAPFLFNASLENHTFWLANPRTEKTFQVHELDGEIQFNAFTDGDVTVQEGLFAIMFYPQGNTSGGVIQFTQPPENDDASHYFITLDPITGRTEIDYVEG